MSKFGIKFDEIYQVKSPCLKEKSLVTARLAAGYVSALAWCTSEVGVGEHPRINRHKEIHSNICLSPQTCWICLAVLIGQQLQKPQVGNGSDR